MGFFTRLRDLIAVFIGLLLLSPVMLLIGIWIKNDSPGPVFYRGLRAARGGGTFQILKFRTMYETPESYAGSKITAEDDRRITPVGSWLRNTKLNELPQLWNVLKGEMSLVGPRPEDPEIVAGWQEELKEEILSVRPGITSPASVLYRDEETLLKSEKVEDSYLNLIQPNKLRLDQLYVRHRSFWLDLDVLFWTAFVLLPQLRSYKPPERRLFVGPLSRLRHRFINWFTIDLIAVLVAFGAAGSFWRTLGPLHLGWPIALLASLGFAVFFSLIGTVFGIQKIHWSKASTGDVWELLLSSLAASGLALLINWRFDILPYQIVVLASMLSLISFVVVRFRTRLLIGFAGRALRNRKAGMLLRERVLIVGCGDAGQFAAWLLENSREASRYLVVGIVDDDLFKLDTRVRGARVLGIRDDIPRIVEENDVGIIIFAIHNISPKESEKLLEICRSTSAQIVIFPNVLAELDLAVERNGKREGREADEDNKPYGAIASDISVNHIERWLEDLKNDLEVGKTAEGIVRINDFQEMLKNSTGRH